MNSINAYWLFLIVPLSIIVGIIIGAVLMSWLITYQIQKALGIKNLKEFINQAKKAQELQKKMEKEGVLGVMNDPELRKQMEELRKKFGKSK